MTLDGSESEELLKSLPAVDPIVALLNTAAGTSRLHASRRVFDIVKASEVATPIIHHREFERGTERDGIVIQTGAEIGGLLVDGLGDGVMLEVPGEDVDYLRTTSFGLLQVPSCSLLAWILQSIRRMRSCAPAASVFLL